MKKSLLLPFFIFAALLAQAQTEKDFTKNFSSKINWYRISDAGTLVVATKDALYGINPVDGSEAWKNEDIENILESNYDPIEGTPYALSLIHI